MKGEASSLLFLAMAAYLQMQEGSVRRESSQDLLETNAIGLVN